MSLGEELILATKAKDENKVRELLGAGADPNYKGQYDYTALRWAVIKESENIVKLLLNAGADPNSRDIVGDPVIKSAFDKNNVAILRLLIDAGADVKLLPHFQQESLRALRLLPVNSNRKPESSLSIFYQERYEDMGEHGTYHNRFYAVTATMEGYSGIIEISFRAEKFFNEGAGEGYLEGISYEWDRQGAVKQLNIYSKKRLLSPNDESVYYKGDHYFPYKMPADIRNPKEFYCYNPNGYMGNSSIEIRELFTNMKEYYKKIFKVKPKQNDLLSFSSPNGDDLRDEGIGYGFKIYT
ncbi:ankyrin repeat domain-containing protein [Brevibacillus agri]|uniref:ankyrin repeat domain-containing protein n=1 Tax=Brevibacillus agri TaxID=51101 RepID=UPI002E244606|nr:ankyrin repeat domain-containing protein [Brevibacillus agri]MED3499085.1 ankyrin repeat domain-containing protein [Brevibacillus agri]